MKRLGLFGLGVVAILVCSGPVLAAGNSYVGLNYVNAEVEDELDLGVVVATVGTHVNEFVSFEGRVGFGVEDDSVFDPFFFGTDVTLDLDYSLGAYVRAEIPLAAVSPYLVLGFSYVEYEISAPGFGSVSDDESDFSYGAGIDFRLTDRFGLNAEYMMLIDKSDIEVENLAFGFKFFF